MFVKKIQQKLNSIPKRDLRDMGITLLCLIIVTFIFHSDVAAMFHNQPAKKPIITIKKSTKKVAKILKPAAVAKPVATPPAPTPTVASTAPSPSVKKTSAPAPAAPVVTPSPSSNVSGLTPTGSTGGSGGTGGTGGTGGSGGSGGTGGTGGTGGSGGSSPTINTYDLTNWSGYMETNGTFTGVSGSWDATNPTGNGSSESADATWIGVGGVTTSDLIQIGTLNNVSPSGQVTSEAFYEMLPAASIDITSITINPGDFISASISEAGTDQFNLTITDNTDSQTFTDTVAYTSSNSSAEWIQEDPSSGFHRLIPLDNFGSVAFSDGYDIINGVSKDILNSGPSLINMVSGSDAPVATTSSLGSDGASFSITQN